MKVCEMCGCDISDRHVTARFCRKCVNLRKNFKDKRLKHKCVICSVDISCDKGGHRYCPDCSCRVREFEQKAFLNHKSIDICPDGCYVTKDEAYINLAGAIVRLTLEDYKYILSMTLQNPRDTFYSKQLEIMIRHIHTEYFDMLCLGIDPDALIRDINNLYNGPKGY